MKNLKSYLTETNQDSDDEVVVAKKSKKCKDCKDCKKCKSKKDSEEE